MSSWEQVLAHIESVLDSHHETITTGVEGLEFVLPASMPAPPPHVQSRIDALQARLAGLVTEHEREMNGLRTSLQAASRVTAGETGSLIDERA